MKKQENVIAEYTNICIKYLIDQYVYISLNISTVIEFLYVMVYYLFIIYEMYQGGLHDSDYIVLVGSKTVVFIIIM